MHLLTARLIPQLLQVPQLLLVLLKHLPRPVQLVWIPQVHWSQLVHLPLVSHPWGLLLPAVRFIEPLQAIHHRFPRQLQLTQMVAFPTSWTRRLVHCYPTRYHHPQEPCFPQQAKPPP